MELQNFFSSTSSTSDFNIGDLIKSKGNISTQINMYYDNLYIVLILCLILVLFYIYIHNDNKEQMSNGVIDQLFAKDQQDMHLNGNIDNIASGRFNLFWNQPTLIANTNNNRGLLYTPPQYVNGINSADTNYAKMIDLTKEVANINNNNTIDGQNNVLQIDKLMHKSEYINNDPASLGTGDGGFRLNADIVNPIYTGQSYVNLDGNIIYKDSYVSAPFYSPIPDINMPLPIISKPV